ncbi:MAG: hypothetical protein GEU79_11415 [Acidimicrobiia bacterium]|nr:hypothetical protein [Acidimicrobiia bacterium]
MFPVLFYIITVAGVYFVLKNQDQRPNGLLLTMVSIGGLAGGLIGGLGGLVIDIITPFSSLTEVGGGIGTLVGAIAIPALTSSDSTDEA